MVALIPSKLQFLECVCARWKLRLIEENIFANLYQNKLGKWLDVPSEFPGASSNWAIFSIRTQRRDELITALSQQGIETRIYYKLPLHLQPIFAKYPRSLSKLLVVEKICKEIVSLPLNPFLTDDEADIIVDAIERFFQ
ncbi:MAG: DegT/DnrJ/EryC1/StrS family aminotransferase [Gammaproteobacteria bacterium]|nr:DegT/DnrJ/EryC1/StrS family aminotransferase [Gammaproteobacteria bacterium]